MFYVIYPIIVQLAIYIPLLLLVIALIRFLKSKTK